MKYLNFLMLLVSLCFFSIGCSYQTEVTTDLEEKQKDEAMKLLEHINDLGKKLLANPYFDASQMLDENQDLNVEYLDELAPQLGYVSGEDFIMEFDFINRQVHYVKEIQPKTTDEAFERMIKEAARENQLELRAGDCDDNHLECIGWAGAQYALSLVGCGVVAATTCGLGGAVCACAAMIEFGQDLSACDQGYETCVQLAGPG